MAFRAVSVSRRPQVVKRVSAVNKMDCVAAETAILSETAQRPRQVVACRLHVLSGGFVYSVKMPIGSVERMTKAVRSRRFVASSKDVVLSAGNVYR